MWLRLFTLTSLLFGACIQEIIKPPKVIDPATTQTVYVEAGEKAVVTCQAEGMPPAIYRWRKNEEVIQPDSDITSDSNTGVLTIGTFVSRDQGTYMCEAYNMKGAASLSPEVKIIYSKVDEFANPNREAELLTGFQFTYYRLNCNYDSEATAPSLVWKWFLGTSSDEVGMDNGRLYIDIEGNLHFTYLEKTDETVGDGSYRCGVKGRGSSTIYLGPRYTLKVQGADSPTASSPQFSYSNSGVQVRLYTTAVLECFFSGYYPSDSNLPIIKWQDTAYTDITDNDKYAITDNGRRLTIKNVQMEDEGDYHCIGSNDVGSSNKMPVTLDIISSPFWNKDGEPKDQTVPEGTNAVFRCDASSLVNEEPPQSPVWFVNAKEFTGSNTDKIRLSGDRKTLTVFDTRKATDNLCVQCKVKNDYGSTWADACLTVILPITIVQEPKHLRQVISYGDRVDMTVIATTDQSVTSLDYSWQFKDKVYTGSPPFVTYYALTTKEAFINTSRLTRDEYLQIEGVYERIISHSVETKIVNIEVILDDGAAAATAAKEFDWWIIGLILSIICLIIVIVLIVFVCHRKHQEGDYNVDKKENTAGYDPERELKQAHFDDFSPPAYIDVAYSDKKPPTTVEMEYDDVPIGGDDESLGEYGEENLTYFNDDGSFIGEYQNTPPRRSHTESTI